MNPLRIRTIKLEPDVAVLEFAGRLVMGEHRRMEDIVLDLLGKEEKKIVFDFSQVDYIDSSGMGSIAYCLTKAARQGATLRVAGLQDRLMPLFRMTRMDQIIPFFSSVPAASTSAW